MGKFIIILALVVVVILAIMLYRKSEYNTISTYSYEMHDRIENGMFFVVLTDDMFCGQSFWVDDKYYGQLSEHPPLEVEYTKMKNEAAVKRIGCPHMSEKNIVKKWH